ncbi:Tetratricopeptide repeat protein 28 [Tupaia chinensis]|uniref:Tetratricopeptide repeat protein 28 n=1 Tax=Tupaia chinensis TaxID=246437 RepID=L9KUP4_TUPCH|nr:Tetratricopeptide repeat protein 28 [Tupaia chinensis]
MYSSDQSSDKDPRIAPDSVDSECGGLSVSVGFNHRADSEAVLVVPRSLWPRSPTGRVGSQEGIFRENSLHVFLPSWMVLAHLSLACSSHSFCPELCPAHSLPCTPRLSDARSVACASSETESEAGDIMDQQFEEMSNKLNSVTDPTGFLRMVRRNNLFNRACFTAVESGAASRWEGEGGPGMTWTRARSKAGGSSHLTREAWQTGGRAAAEILASSCLTFAPGDTQMSPDTRGRKRRLGPFSSEQPEQPRPPVCPLVVIPHWYVMLSQRHKPHVCPCPQQLPALPPGPVFCAQGTKGCPHLSLGSACASPFPPPCSPPCSEKVDLFLQKWINKQCLRNELGKTDVMTPFEQRSGPAVYVGQHPRHACCGVRLAGSAASAGLAVPWTLPGREGKGLETGREGGRSCPSMTSLFSSAVSPVKDGTSSLPRRQSSLAKPPLRALYDLLIAPMEGSGLDFLGQGQHLLTALPRGVELLLDPPLLVRALLPLTGSPHPQGHCTTALERSGPATPRA